MPGPNDNPFSGLISQVLGATASVKGLSATLGGATSALQSFSTLMSGNVIGALGQFVSGVAKAVAGLAAMGVAALAGGFTVLGQVTEYLTAVIGSVGVPVFGVLAAVALTLADMFRDTLFNAAKSVALFMANDFLAALKTVGFALETLANFFGMGYRLIKISVLLLVQAFREAADYLLSFIGKDDPATVAAKRRQVDAETDKLADEFLGIAKAQAGAMFQREQDQRKGGAANPAGGFLALVADNLESIIKSLTQAMAQKGNVGFSGLADVAKQVQLQSFQSDLAKRTLDIQVKSLDMLKFILAEIRKQVIPAVGA